MPACEPLKPQEHWLQAPLYLLQWISERLGGAANYKLTDYEIKYTEAEKVMCCKYWVVIISPFLLAYCRS